MKLLKKKKLKKAECIYIGNAFSDYRAAKLNKINYIHFDKDNKNLKIINLQSITSIN